MSNCLSLGPSLQIANVIPLWPSAVHLRKYHGLVVWWLEEDYPWPPASDERTVLLGICSSLPGHLCSCLRLAAFIFPSFPARDFTSCFLEKTITLLLTFPSLLQHNPVWCRMPTLTSSGTGALSASAPGTLWVTCLCFPGASFCGGAPHT